MNANDLFKAVTELNLDQIKMKLMHVESGEGWSLEKANAVEKEYRRFLCLMKLFPEENTAPLVDVDTFWHYHILDTMKYAADCDKVFGYFLHHYPYVGMDGTAEDEQFRLDSGNRMQELYESVFGEAYPAMLTGTAQQPQTRVEGAATAWCASPFPPNRESKAAGTVAWCASPFPPHRESKAAGTVAWCASPFPPHRESKAPGTVAWCASPFPPNRESKAAGTVAWCASPFPPHQTPKVASPIPPQHAPMAA
jgi:hypothetical protein